MEIGISAAVDRFGFDLALFHFPGQGAERPDFVQEIGHVQKPGFFQADIDECGLHPRQHPHHPALVHVAGQPSLGIALDHEFGHHAVLQKRDSHLQGRSVDDQFASHAWFVPSRMAGRRPAR